MNFSVTTKLHYIAFITILTKEVKRFLRIWPQTILPPVITMGLYFVIFGNLIGPRIGLMKDIPYIQFIAPGLIMMAVITNAYSNVCSSFFSLKFQKSIEELVVSPTPDYVILLGFVGGGIARGLVTGIAVTIIAELFTDLRVQHFFLTFLVIFLAATLFSLAGFINAVFARKFDDVAIVPTFILTPLTYLGGVFYSIDMLSPFWQVASQLNPILYMVSSFRYGMLGITDAALHFSLLFLIIFIGILFGISMFLLKKGVGIKN